MSTLLRPDIVVASKIRENIEIAKAFCNDNAESYVYISVDSCVAHQNKCKEMGFENIFTGDGNKDWNNTDYESYIKRFPQYFIKENEKSPFYKVELSTMRADAKCNQDISRVLCSKLLVDGAYTPRTIKMLGLE